MLIVGSIYEVKESTYIDASPDEVWKTFAHIHHWAEWSRYGIEASAPTGDPWRVGGRLHIVMKPWWLPIATNPAVVEFEPPGTVVWVSNPAGIQRQTTVHFDADHRGCKAGISIWQQGPLQWTLPFYSPSWSVRRCLRELLTGLKSAVEFK